jgi:hypothetical protein
MFRTFQLIFSASELSNSSFMRDASVVAVVELARELCGAAQVHAASGVIRNP